MVKFASNDVPLHCFGDCLGSSRSFSGVFGKVGLNNWFLLTFFLNVCK